MRWYFFMFVVLSFFVSCSKPEDVKTSIDMGSNDMTADILEDMVLALPKKKISESCGFSVDCERGLVCVEKVCTEFVGCEDDEELRTDEETGCLYVNEFSVVFTAKECDSDTDCVTSKDGQNCIDSVCTAQTRCMEDGECLSGQMCFRKIVCLDK